MSLFVSIGELYLGADKRLKQQLVNYYNVNCVHLVKPERQYHIKMSDEWCAMFVSAIAHKTGFKVGQFPYEVSVAEQVKISVENNTFKSANSIPVIGDLIIYDWFNDGTYDHVGIVAGVDGGLLKILEGNYKNTVGYRVVKSNAKVIKGYIGTCTKPTIDELDRIDALVRLTLKGSFGDGVEREQALGDDYLPVQKLVNELLKG